jgi:hypothetical protein
MVSALAGSTQAIGKEYTLAHPTPMDYVDYLHLFSGAVGKE